MHVGALELRVELIRVDIHTIAVLLLAETDDEGHDMDTQGLRIRWSDVGRAVGDQVDQLTRARARTGSAPVLPPAARTRCPGGSRAGARPARPPRPWSPPDRGTP